MPKRDRVARMRSLRKRVLEYDVARWSTTFLTTLAGVRGDRENAEPDLDLDDPLGELEWTVERAPRGSAL
jgi:trehalose 6-phosphate synthase